MLVIGSLLLSVFAWWNHGLHALDCGFLNDGITVVALISNQVLRVEAGNELVGLSAIRSGTFCNKRSERHTMRIHGQMYLCVEPPFVRLMP